MNVLTIGECAAVYIVNRDKKQSSTFDFVLSDEQDRQLTAFERSSMENVMRDEERKQDSTLDSQVVSTGQR